MSNFVIGPCLNTVIWGNDRMFCHDIRLWQPRPDHATCLRKTWDKINGNTDSGWTCRLLATIKILNIQSVREHWPKPWRPNWLSFPSFCVVSWCCILTWEDVGTQVFTLCVFFSPVVDLVSRPFPICSRMSPRAPRIQNDNFVRPGHQPSLDRQRKLKNLKNKSVRWGKIRWVFILSEAEIWSSHRIKDIKRSINYFYLYKIPNFSLGSA